jgi:hypothetical protein
VTGYEISNGSQTMFAGSDVSTKKAILTIKTAATQQSLTVKWSDAARLRNQLGPYLAQIDARPSQG